MLRKKLQQWEKGIYRLAIILAGIWVLIGALYLFSQAEPVQATSGDLNVAIGRYPAINGTRLDSCSLCHTASIPQLNPFGSAYLSNGRNNAALGAIENLDSDGDGFTNLQEITALTFPGNASDSPSPPTPTNTTAPPSVTPTNTTAPPSVTPTNTTAPPSVTPTNTSIAPSATFTSTSISPSVTPTQTSLPPSATPTATGVTPSPVPSATVVPPQGVDLDIQGFKVTGHIKLGRSRPVEIRLDVRNRGGVDGQGSATVSGVQNGVEVYRQTITVSDPPQNGANRYFFPSFTPTTRGDIRWTVTLSDGNPDNDVSTDRTRVSGGRGEDDDDDEDGDDDDDGEDDEDDDEHDDDDEDEDDDDDHDDHRDVGLTHNWLGKDRV